MHYQLLEDIARNGLEGNIVYSRYFYKTLKDEFGLEYGEATKAEILYMESLYDGYDDYLAEIIDTSEY